MKNQNRWTVFVRFLAVLTGSLLLAGCTGTSDAPDPFDPPAVTPTPAPSDWLSFEAGEPPAEVESVHPELFPGIRITLPEEQGEGNIAALPDGGCLAVSQTPVGPGDAADPVFQARAIRYRPDGSAAWDRALDMEEYRGYLTGFCSFPDGSFAVGIRFQYSGTAYYDPVDRLYRFDAEAGLLWRSEDRTGSGESLTAAGSMEKLFAMPDGATVAAGTVTEGEVNRISLLRFGPDGTLENRLLLGKTSYSYLMDADYHSAAGLVLVWRENADTTPGANPTRDRLWCGDGSLAERWSATSPAGEPLAEVQALDDGSVLAMGFHQDGGSSRSALFGYDSGGGRMWGWQTAGDSVWIGCAARLTDGRLAAASYRNSEDGGMVSSVTILTEDGDPDTEIPDLPGRADRIWAEPDGGFTLVCRRDVRTIPQPPYISSIWTDTEAIVARYAADGTIRWRRTVDLYKYSRRADTLLPGPDGALFVG